MIVSNEINEIMHCIEEKCIIETLKNRTGCFKFKSKENMFTSFLYGLYRFSRENTILKTEFALVSFKRDSLLAPVLTGINGDLLQFSTVTCLFELRPPGYFTVISVDQ